jgi:hypothetical protein
LHAHQESCSSIEDGQEGEEERVTFSSIFFSLCPHIFNLTLTLQSQ